MGDKGSAVMTENPFGITTWDIQYLFLKPWWRFQFMVEWKLKKLLTGLGFLHLAFSIAFGKLGIIEIEPARAVGGYKYMVIVLSILPVSANHDYSKWFKE